ncbi:thioredoxin [Candidatus Micrarchaeota archaeon]|nr:thioredoxin [Candidatus Micrarchaeota archaeon]
MALVNADDSSFEKEVLQSKEVAIVDFYADWCGPCQMMAPKFEQLAHEMQGKAKFVKLNTDTSPKTAQAYGVMSIPTLIVFKGGKVVDQTTGAIPRDNIQQLVERHL